MTSKSPVRSCEDVDETVLSYAEIKALCAGNPLIVEKMNLDIDVARLRMLKADYQSQHYRLEESLLKHYPKQIASAKERIAGLESDIENYQKQLANSADVQMLEGSASVTAKFAGMMINGKTYVEKEPAAKALLDACSTVKSIGQTPIGNYMGFEMSLQFESFDKSFKLLLKGKATQTIELGKDAFGNITRINNALAGLPERLAEAKTGLERLENQQTAAQAELEKPFHQADELAEKEARLVELNAQLSHSDEAVATTDEAEHADDGSVAPNVAAVDFSRNVDDFNEDKEAGFINEAADYDEDIAV